MQQWYSLRDPAMEDTLIDVPTMRQFAGIDRISERIPDESTILGFGHVAHEVTPGFYPAALPAAALENALDRGCQALVGIRDHQRVPVRPRSLRLPRKWRQKYSESLLTTELPSSSR